jgi:3-deoxy-manno-octulosonate cytidylyltransferase (CMP-KDO synthetase)
MVVGIIPARYGSSRFPGKPLAMIAGQPMIWRVYERANEASKISQVYVATDDERIASVVRDFGGEVIMTHPAHATGTDRVAAAADETRADIIVNIQGDEPLIDPEIIDEAIEPLLASPTIDVATTIIRLSSANDLHDPNIVKVVLGEGRRALYFSRAAIPFQRDVPQAKWLENQTYWKHVGLYAYRRAALQNFAAGEQTDLERAEQLEQLRFLSQGAYIYCVETEYETIAVDRPEDIMKVEALMTVRNYPMSNL